MSDNENDNYSSEDDDVSENELSEKEESDKEDDVEAENPSIKKLMTAVEDSDEEDELPNNEQEDDDDIEEEEEDVELDENDDIEEEEGDQIPTKYKTSSSKSLEQHSNLDMDGNDDDDDNGSISDDQEDELDDETYLQKFNEELNKNYILEYHPECSMNNYDEIIALTNVIRDEDNNIIDDLHKTLPYLTKYERARVLGQRSKQINSGAKVFVKVPENVIDGYIIAQIELEQKRIPFIIRRPIPGGGCEYWNLKDLEMIGF